MRIVNFLSLVAIVLFAVLPAAAQESTTTADLNLRRGPSTTYMVLETLAAGTAVLVEGQDTAGEWLLVSASGARGWVSAQYIAGAPTDPPHTDERIAPQTRREAVLRQGPGDAYLPLGVLPAETEIEIVGRSAGGDWLLLDEGLGWLETGAVTIAGEHATLDALPAQDRMIPQAFEVGDRVREVFARGQALGRDPHAFSKVGDCNSRAPFFLNPFDYGSYTLGAYADLQPAIEHFAGSFDWESQTAMGMGRADLMFDPLWTNPAFCEPGETPIACEFRRRNPSVVIIALGTWDLNMGPTEEAHAAAFEAAMRALIDYAIEEGVIPILGTKVDSGIEGEDTVNNQVIRRLAAEYGLPLWDFGQVAPAIPGRGLWDGRHLSWAEMDYTKPETFAAGHPVRNLMVLHALDAVWRGAMR